MIDLDLTVSVGEVARTPLQPQDGLQQNRRTTCSHNGIAIGFESSLGLTDDRAPSVKRGDG